MLFEIRFKNILTGKEIIVYKRGLTSAMAIEKARESFRIPGNYRYIGPAMQLTTAKSA